MIRRIGMIGAAVMTTLLALVIFWQFRVAVIYLLISLMLAAVIRPLTTRLAGKGWLVRVGWILLFLVALGGFGYALFLVSQTAVQEIQRLGVTLSVKDSWSLPVWLEGSAFQKALLGRLPPPSQLLEAVTGGQGQNVLPALLGFTQGIGAMISAGVIITLLSVYWSISQVHFERLWLSLLQSGQRSQARGIWRIIESDTGSYIRGQVMHSLLAGLLFGLGYWLIGSPYPVFLGMLGAVACLIPVVGSVLALIPPLLIGLLSSVQISLFMVIYTSAVLIVLGLWIKPLLYRQKWNNPILTIVLMLALADGLGLVGLFIAPPLSVVCQILWSHLISHRKASGAAAQISDLKERQAYLIAAVHVIDGPPLPLVTSSMERLAQLLEKAETILIADQSAINLAAAPSAEQEENRQKGSVV